MPTMSFKLPKDSFVRDFGLVLVYFWCTALHIVSVLAAEVDQY